MVERLSELHLILAYFEAQARHVGRGGMSVSSKASAKKFNNSKPLEGPCITLT